MQGLKKLDWFYIHMQNTNNLKGKDDIRAPPRNNNFIFL